MSRRVVGFTGNAFSCSTCFIDYTGVSCESGKRNCVCTDRQKAPHTLRHAAHHAAHTRPDANFLGGFPRDSARGARPRASRHVRWGTALALYGTTLYGERGVSTRCPCPRILAPKGEPAAVRKEHTTLAALYTVLYRNYERNVYSVPSSSASNASLPLVGTATPGGGRSSRASSRQSTRVDG